MKKAFTYQIKIIKGDVEIDVNAKQEPTVNDVGMTKN